ncbi:MAG: DUF6569 family protein [Candidatus Acidiferrum sp.]
MDRSLFSLFGSVLGLTALGFVWSGSGSSATPPKSEGDWRLLDPISYENLTVFPVVSSFEFDTSNYITLEQGLSSGDVIVREQGEEALIRDRNPSRQYFPTQGGASVNRLVLLNRGKQPLLLLAGELVSGGKQDRIIAKDRIVAPGSDPLPLDVFCVEHGRWSAGSQFSAARTIVHPSVREQAAVEQSQSQVWEAVSVGSTASSSAMEAGGTGYGNAVAPAPRVSQSELSAAIREEAPTQSYAKLYGSRRVGASVDAMVEQLQKRFQKETAGLKGERVVGVVVAYGGEVAWSDIFASAALFNAYWNKLLRSYAVEAVARPTLREVSTVEQAREFLQRRKGREQTESEAGVYRWREVSDGSISQIELDSLEPKVITIHRMVLRRSS